MLGTKSLKTQFSEEKSDNTDLPRQQYKTRNKVTRNSWLDLLRCIAITLVFVRHGHNIWLQEARQDLGWLDFIMLNGWIGVDLFFVLSGYLIAKGLISSRFFQKNSNLGIYFLKRSIRIFPAYLTVLFISAAGLIPLYNVSKYNLSWRLLYHVLLMQDYLPSDINVVFWSLGTEFKFYAIAPWILSIMFLAYARGNFRLLIFGLILISPSLRILTYFINGEPTNYSLFWPLMRSPFHTSLEPLFLGLAIALLEAKGHLKLSRENAIVIFGLTLALLLGWSASHDFMAITTLFDAVLQPLIIAFGFAITVAASISLEQNKLPGNRIFLGVANLSYSLYLVHYLWIPLALKLSNTVGNSAGIYVYWGVYIALSILSAWILYLAIERPFLRLRNTLLFFTPK